MSESEQVLINYPLNFFWEKDDSFCIRVQGSPEEEHVRVFLEDVASLFYTFPDQEGIPMEQQIPTFNVLQQMTPDLRKGLIKMCEKMAKKSPQINQAISKFKLVNEGEYFFVYPKLPDDSLQYSMRLQFYLTGRNLGLSEEDANKYLEEQYQSLESFFGTELNNYDIKAFGKTSRKSYIGTKPTQGDGACRFCKQTVNDGATFKKIAHTISEALGNKQIITNDECDVCNGIFGDEIEPHLIRYLDIHRAYFQIKGKSGIPKLKFRNGHVAIVKDDNETGSFVIASQDVTKTENGMIITLKPYDPVNKQKVFKSLCKYALSVLDVEDLKDFEKTTQWVRGAVQIGKNDPQLSIAKHFMHEYSSHPHFSVFKRKDDADPSLPHVIAELKMGTLNMIFIVPFSAKDENHFDIKRDFEKLNGIFPRYEMVKELLDFEDLSCSEDKIYPVVINMEKREGAPNAEPL
ncbi:HNH endonuclease [Acinetobacter bereziniae]|uniref:HNH endonuclease n=1 Tax=Acinetobacter bereziniae TaxID=106648 RepID=UPI0019060A34|nr:HNH endonuclease [Acinetobacter bereziniae]MDG3555305.1 HNH endonuclease [Acinetobacter bereziniae]QQC81431.1 hypothetical protein I9192_04855 [Acinetobacter bereziniae]UUN94541.1 HNH endonuclease [Acinetobacter bereziniae]WMW75605.1 HNH endonuclease [Acinetobacter bereziniae]